MTEITTKEKWQAILEKCGYSHDDICGLHGRDENGDLYFKPIWHKLGGLPTDKGDIPPLTLDNIIEIAVPVVTSTDRYMVHITTRQGISYVAIEPSYLEDNKITKWNKDLSIALVDALYEVLVKE